jgi:electron transfer flavoprotein beta subunit
MKAKKKPLDTMGLGDFGVGDAPAFKTVRVDPPPQRSKGVMVKDVAELVDALKKKGLV